MLKVITNWFRSLWQLPSDAVQSAYYDDYQEMLRKKYGIREPFSKDD